MNSLLKKELIFLKIYYALLFVAGYYGVSSAKSIITKLSLDESWILIIDSGSIFLLSVLLFTIIWPKFPLRLASALAINVFYGLLFYLADSTFHSVHPWLISCLFIAFVSVESPNHFRNKLIGRIVPVLLLSHYFFSGIQKLVIPVSEYSSIPQVILNHFYLNSISDQFNSTYMANTILKDFPHLLVLGTFLVVIFELSALLAILNQKYRKTFVWGTVVFHSLTLILMNVPFTFTPIAMILCVGHIDQFLGTNQDPQANE